MSEGSAVGYVSRWLINEDGTTGQLQAAAALSAVRVTYRPRNNEDYIADSGRIEAIYWGLIDTDVEVRGFKGGVNIKYAEEARRTLHLIVAGATADDTASDIEERGYNLLGEIVKAVQEAQPTSPGSHLQNIRVFVSDWDADPGLLPHGGVEMPAISFEIEVTIQANVEQ